MMTDPGPAPDEDGGHEESAVTNGHGGIVAPVPDPPRADPSVIDLRPGRLPEQSPEPSPAPHSSDQHSGPPAFPSADGPRGTSLPSGQSLSGQSLASGPRPDPVTELHGPRAVRPRRALVRPTRSVAAAILPPLALLVATMVLVSFLLTTSAAEARVALALSRSVDSEQADQLASDQVWAGVLGLVASGVGQTVVDPDGVATSLGAARSDLPGPVPSDSGSDALVVSAVDSHEAFLTAVEDALERAGGNPVELGNELSDLDAAHRRSNGDNAALVASLQGASSSAQSDSRRLAGMALALGLLGLVATAAASVWARRRLSDHLDEPAEVIADTLRRFADGEVTVRTHRRTPSGLGALAATLDDDLDTISEEFDRLHRRAAWGEQSRMIFEALDETDDEDGAYEVVRRALSMIDESHHPVELLLSERGSTSLESVAHDSTTVRPGCPVDATGACVALRRGQVAVFESSESINACPKLRDRPGGPCSAICVPVTVATRPVGVLHMTGPDLAPPAGAVSDRLVTLSVQIGNRLGALRTLESTRKDASTDKLTGLPNRRKLEAEVATLLERETPFVLVLADLDKFKKLNDSFGHEIGDKALQLFSAVLRDNVRGNDVVSRLGGEEFVLVYPNMSVEISIEAIGRLRQALARAIAASRLPAFTCSFGVTHSDVGGDGDWILRVADAGLLRAKELGGDQAVFADEELAATVFPNETPPKIDRWSQDATDQDPEAPPVGG